MAKNKNNPKKDIFTNMVTDDKTKAIIEETIKALKQSNEVLAEFKRKIFPFPHEHPELNKAIESNEEILKQLPK